MGKVNQRLQDLDPKSSPHLEKKWIGGGCRSRSPLLDPSRMSKNHGGNQEGKQVLPRATMEVKKGEELTQPKVEEGLFIAQEQI